MKARSAAVCLVLAVARLGFAQQLFRGDHAAMGTVYSIALYASDADKAKGALQASFEEIDRVDDLLSNYKASSEISRINRDAGQGAVVTDPETFRFLAVSLAYSQLTHGAFDISVGRLLRTWGFFDHHGAVPTPQQRAADRAGVGWQHVHLDAAQRSVRFQGSVDLELDPGGIGKGYAVDRVVAVLRALGVTSALISAGTSSIAGLGAPPGTSGWPVQIPDPRHAGMLLQTVELHDVTLSTSACSEKNFIEKGHLYCHIFDPRTLVPVEGMLQTTVMSPLAVESDALSTGLFVADAKERARILDQKPEDATLLIVGDRASATLETTRWPDAAAVQRAFRGEQQERP